MKIEELVASDDEVESYKDDKLEVKVYGLNYPKSSILFEALINARIEETGLNIPKVIEVSKINGRWAITSEYIEGESLYTKMLNEPNNIEMYINDMVELQLEVQKKRSPFLYKLKDKLMNQINNLDCIDSARKYELLMQLDSMPKHVKLCHGDFNPTNIVIHNNNMYIKNWSNASQGNASADVANSYLFFALHMPEYAKLYIDTFCKKSNTELKYVQQWLAIVSAARLSEQMEDENDLLMNWIDVVDYQ
ncbi:phosphotransferase [Anaeromicropila herbilytica]|uniref:Aminoglycoside phosphotransferase n=1 Tax=Anaeromicropila herbilytica TaxID=2785025 RepID=A0A7R7IGD8_9FIRM|nr:phosphotransferase [Anaeromicropila herbilytica]BCN32993.1 aminoglycoside phosphotransferase [Anaeromicropila herbilytica]